MSTADRNLRHRDTLTVRIGGADEDLTVYNWCTVERWQRFRANQVEEFEPKIYPGDMDGGAEPKAITTWLAESLRDEGVTIPDRIRVIDPASAEVTVL